MSEKFNNYNIANSIEFKAKIKSFKEHLDLYKQIDLSLDTFPYNGVTTSFESLWMGVPMLTMKGFNFNSRCGESININLGMQKLIAKDFENYIEIASFYASNNDKLLDLRNEVYEKLLESPHSLIQKNFLKIFINVSKHFIKKNLTRLKLIKYDF